MIHYNEYQRYDKPIDPYINTDIFTMKRANSSLAELDKNIQLSSFFSLQIIIEINFNKNI